MNAALEEKLRRRMELEDQLPTLEAKERELKEKALQLKYELREAEMNLHYLEGSSPANWLRRVLGKQEQALENSQRVVRDLKAEALQTGLELERTEGALRSGRQELAELAECCEECEKALATTGEMPEDILRHKCRLQLRRGIRCAGQLLEALEAGRDRGRRDADPTHTRAQLARMRVNDLSAAEAHAGELAQCLDALARLGVELPGCPYLSNPAGYLATASDYAQLDRINLALDQIYDIRRKMEQLL